MHRILRRGLISGVFTAGCLILGAEAASAATNDNDPQASTSGHDGLLSGNQVLVDLDVPVDLSGNAISVLGDSSTEAAPAPREQRPVRIQRTTGDGGVGSGNQVTIAVHLPVTVRGQAVSVLGDSTTTSEAPSSAPPACPTSRTTTRSTTSGEDGLLAGNQVGLDVHAPIDVTGNAISVVGDAASRHRGNACAGSTSRVASTPTTSGEDSLGGGNQVIAPITAPVDATNNAVAVIGNATTSSTEAPGTTGTSTGGTTEAGPTTTGSDSVGGGNQVAAPITAPIDVGDNATAIVGDATVVDDARATDDPGDSTGDSTGDSSVGGDPNSEVSDESAMAGASPPMAGRVLPSTGAGGYVVPGALGPLLVLAGIWLMRRSASTTRGGPTGS